MQNARCTLEIDLAKIRTNYRIISEICKNSEVAAVVKANSYGLGADNIAPALQLENCQNFFVNSVNEGIALRKVLGSKSNIFVFHGVFYNDVEEFSNSNLIPVLNNLQQVAIWQKLAAVKQQLLRCTIHIDTGMNRLGMSDIEIQRIIDNPDLLAGLELQYVISHLSASEMVEEPYNLQQLTKFKHYLKYLPTAKASLANSSSIFLGDEYHFDLIRPGAALYGLNPLGNKSKNPMHNPIKLTAPIIQLKELPPESYIGYNMTFKTNRNRLIATLPLGYADGYSRAFSNCGEVCIDSHLAPVVGRVSMDLITIDVTELPPNEIFLGQQVEIIGDYCTPDKIANIINTIGYEIFTMLGDRYKRVYKNDY
ncbi:MULTISPECIES: alanine racemase [unclassified Candidatus Tisiphia]|uniref:alanine racemase n=1 Tax=unclassified Candidatus Tisiphia TaxID=2996318 RepID=UPI00312CBB26